MEADIQIYSEALGQATWDQPKSRKNDNMSKGVKIMMGKPTEPADLS